MEEIIIIPAIFIGLPWLILHYITKWKTSATITTDDEALLEELYSLAKRLDDRMDRRIRDGLFGGAWLLRGADDMRDNDVETV